MPVPPAPASATPSRDLDHREVFARFVDRLADRLPRPGGGKPAVRTL
jgi:hypothetical protein